MGPAVRIPLERFDAQGGCPGGVGIVGGKLFELVPRGSLPPYDARGYQVSFAVEDIEAARTQLVEAGVQPLSEIEGGPDSPYRWCSFRDPEGNVFGITQRNH